MLIARAEGIKHKKNEIFLDVVEKLNLLVCYCKDTQSVMLCAEETIGSVKRLRFPIIQFHDDTLTFSHYWDFSRFLQMDPFYVVRFWAH